MAKFDPYHHLKLILKPDGTLQRSVIAQVSANPNPTQGELVASKDVTIDTQKNIWVRIYCPTKLPANDRCVARLPLVMYFHSGGFIDHSVSDIVYHERCNLLSKNIPAIVVSLEYRLAPEHRLPAQYEDAMDAILWVQKQASSQSGEQWLREYADFSRCYLMGRANGANIAYNASLRAVDIDLKPLRICGAILNQPMFSGKHRTKSELKYACDELMPLPVWDLMWELALPKGADRDHRFCNPMKDNFAKQSKIGKIGKCLVIGYGMDAMVDRQQEFVTMLVSCGARVEAHFDDIGFHNIDIVDSKRGAYNLHLVREFVN
ncbi:putative carboxylesterase 9 [Silene latifolia]|uniref:putative carboxylesterase 9 n=1 Tax=Silene latifolia TaxID=37657 RepID=UPI003D77904E